MILIAKRDEQGMFVSFILLLYGLVFSEREKSFDLQIVFTYSQTPSYSSKLLLHHL